jgi:hypothetical protein
MLPLHEEGGKMVLDHSSTTEGQFRQYFLHDGMKRVWAALRLKESLSCRLM